MNEIGAVCFGVVVGWITYRTLRRTEKTAISDLASVIGAVGGASVVSLFDPSTLFAYYAIGLAIGFFGYLVLGHTVFADDSWLGGAEE
jgi:hypothetical protein